MLAIMEQTLAFLERLHTRKTPSATATTSQQTGEAGERAAYFHVRRQGFTVVARRWRYALLDGEVDLIAWEGDTLCFVEVKTRAAATPFAAEFHVNEDKQAAVRRMAAAYINQLPWRNRQPADVQQRFDVVSVYHQPNGTHDVRLLRDAFR